MDALLFDSILLMIVLCILDDAFEANIKSVEDVYRVRVKKPRRSYRFQWKAEKLDIPVFHQPIMTPDSVRTSETLALHYHTFVYYLQRLGLLAGLIQLLVAHMLRRGAGEAVERTSMSLLIAISVHLTLTLRM